MIKILCVDDRPKNLIALEAVLETLDICIVKAESGQEALEHVLTTEFALILLDVQMPGMDGFETASLIRTFNKSKNIPIIFVTAISFEDKHIFRGYGAGAVDYLFKPIDPYILTSKVKIFIELFKQRQKATQKARELEQANLKILEQQKALQESEIRFRTAFDQSFQCMVILDTQGRILEINDLACKLYGKTGKEVTGKWLWETCRSDAESEKEALKEKIQRVAQGNRTIDEIDVYDNNGEKRTLLQTIFPVKDSAGAISYITVQEQDITRRKQAEQEKINLVTQLRQAQKMEALGTLAGGIAHDFNNILSVILGYSELGCREASENSKVKKHLSKILVAANKAMGLVRQILGFVRQTSVEQVVFRPAAAIEEGIKLLRASLPATIEIRLDIDSRCGAILADPTQFHQILMNFCTNAYHVMESSGGCIDISLREVDVDDYGLVPGKYAHLSVTDTGLGMDEKTLEKIFDPYFTTKEIGKGTGLGLSIVHGIVKSHKGHIWVESELGKGSVFHVYFPISEQKKLRPVPPSFNDIARRGHILVVDDEQDFLDVIAAMMGLLGYNVTAEQNSEAALDLFLDNPSQFDLVMTDYTMPEMNGVEMAEKMIGVRPNLPVILCTGYSQDFTTTQMVREKGIRSLIFKPLTCEDLDKVLQKHLG